MMENTAIVPIVTIGVLILSADEWNETYKIRSIVKKFIADRRTRNEKTLHADLLLAGITQLITIVLANHIEEKDAVSFIR